MGSLGQGALDGTSGRDRAGWTSLVPRVRAAGTICVSSVHTMPTAQPSPRVVGISVF